MKTDKELFEISRKMCDDICEIIQNKVISLEPSDSADIIASALTNVLANHLFSLYLGISDKIKDKESFVNDYADKLFSQVKDVFYQIKNHVVHQMENNLH